MIVSFENRESGESESWSARGLASLIGKRQSRYVEIQSALPFQRQWCPRMPIHSFHNIIIMLLLLFSCFTCIRHFVYSGEDARCLIAPMHIEVHSDEGSLQSYTATRRTSSTKTAKNHLKANRQALKERQKSNNTAALEEKRGEEIRRKKLEQKKEKLFGNVRSRVFDPTSSNISTACTSTTVSLSSMSSTASTVDTNIAFGKKVPKTANLPRQSVCNEPTSGQSKHKSYGKVPSYITDRKAKIEREEQEQKRLQENAPPAPGFVLMEESERLETMRILEENEKKERDVLLNIPFSMNGHRAARLREAIEFRLREIEDAKRIFSKDRVFVEENNY